MKNVPKVQQFASDNYSGICPQAWSAMERANNGHVQAYGDDNWTHKAADMFRELFAADCEVFFVFNGTAGNSLALASLCQSYNAVICHELAHIETDECGAPEFFSNGAKILTGKGDNGKLTPESVTEIITRRDDLHYPKPKVLSLTQATEVGTLYSPSELKEVCTTARRHGLRIHMDGARFANAIAAIGCQPRELTVDCGVDVLCFGGTKNGMAVGDAVVFFNKDLAEDFERRCKQAGQLASKMRFIAAPWVGLLEHENWLKHACHANECAAYLEQKLKKIKGVKILFPRQVNSIFIEFDDEAKQKLAGKGWMFYSFIGAGSRLMCSWDTSYEEIDRFIVDVASSLSR